VLFNDKLYQVLKKVVQLGLPGSGTLYFTLAQLWGLPYPEEVVGTVSAIALFLGILLGVSTRTYNQNEDQYDGTLAIENHEDGSTLRMKNVDLDALVTKQSVVFKVVQPEVPPVINY